MTAKKLGAYTLQQSAVNDEHNQSFSVFVTGNPNKLKEVKDILASSGHPIQIDAQSLDREYTIQWVCST
jgi:hypothetical protein